MTIAACYVSSEGVILGADSTTTYATGPGAFRYYNNAQKVFEVGDNGSTLGIAIWGLGGLRSVSYRQLTAELSDELLQHPPQSVLEAAQRWGELLWRNYVVELAPDIQRLNALRSIQNPTQHDKEAIKSLHQSLIAGFYFGGHVKASRASQAFIVNLDPIATAPPLPVEIPRNMPAFAGAPNILERLLNGIDRAIYSSILKSGKWNGKQDELDAIIAPHGLHPRADIPFREAIDWIYSSIFVTIKAMKFSTARPTCGGPIELAVISADRHFRWVCHKGLDQALTDHLARGTRET
jgi:hypothetical protein